MRIGIVSGEYPPMQGGVGAYSQIIARTMAAQGYAVFVYTHAQAENDDAAVVVKKAAQNWDYGTLRNLRKWALENRLDVLNLQYQTAAYRMSPWIHFMPELVRPVPLVTTFHDLLFPYLFPKAGPLRTWIVNRLARASAAVIATNHEDYHRLRFHPQLTMIPIGSNISVSHREANEVQAWRKKAGAGQDDLLIAYFGFLNRSKGVDTLLTVVKRLRERDIACRLLMVGGRTGSSDPTNASYAEFVDREVVRLNVENEISWTGFIDDTAVAGYLAAADVVALPFRDGASYRRGTLMAAIQHGCAIVTTTPQVEIETFRDGENMLLVPADDPDMLVAALLRCRDDAALVKRLQMGAKSLAGTFDWGTIAADCVSVFEKVCTR